MRNFKILHTMVGPFPVGRVVPEDEFVRVEGADVQRLIDIGAVEVTTEPETTEPAPLGPHNQAEPGNEGPPPAEAPVDPTNYAAMSLATIRAQATQRGVTNANQLTKAQLTKILQDADKQPG